MKKTIAILLAAVLLLGMLSACGKAPEEENTVPEEIPPEETVQTPDENTDAE